MIRRIFLNLLTGAAAAILIACGGNAASPAPTATNVPTPTPPAATPTPPSTPPSTPAPSSAPSCNYSYATFKDATGADAKFLYSNNDNGAMVGVDSTGRGFIFQNGQFTYLTLPASLGATAATGSPNAIANNGLVAGTFVTGAQPNSTTHAFIYNNGQYTTFDAPNSNSTRPSGISSDGTVVGQASSIAIYGSDWIRHPDGTLASLDDGSIPSGLRQPGDINDSDIVVLAATSDTTHHQNQYATWQNGTFTYHDFPLTDLIIAPNGNNNLGDIVGDSQTNDVVRAWALLGSSTVCTIAYPGAVQTIAQDINGSRVIVGYYSTGQFVYHAFVATPQ